MKCTVFKLFSLCLGTSVCGGTSTTLRNLHQISAVNFLSNKLCHKKGTEYSLAQLILNKVTPEHIQVDKLSEVDICENHNSHLTHQHYSVKQKTCGVKDCKFVGEKDRKRVTFEVSDLAYENCGFHILVGAPLCQDHRKKINNQPPSNNPTITSVPVAECDLHIQVSAASINVTPERPLKTSADTSVNNIPSVKELPQNESTNAPTDIFMFLNSLSLLNVIILAICVVIVLYLIILMIVAMICLGRNKDKNTAGRYSINIAHEYQGEKRKKDESEESDEDLEVRNSFSSGNSSSSPRSFDTVITTSDRENLGPRKLNFLDEEQDKTVPLNLSSFDESDPDISFVDQ